MIAERRSPEGVTFSRAELSVALADERGVPYCGRVAELDALAAVGARDLSAGRLFEGHVNGVQLVARYGSAAQRRDAESDVLAGRLFAVWNTAGDDALRVDADHGVFRGGKTWASGARRVDRPLVTARTASGLQMYVVPLDAVDVRIDASGWQPLGMHASDSVAVDFDGVPLTRCAAIGAPGDYANEPWFSGGALRFCAVQCGGIERLVDETIAFLRARGRDSDALQASRIGEMRVAARTARLWIDDGRRAWTAFDDAPTPVAADHVRLTVDMARAAVERAALDVLERAVRCVGAVGLTAPHPFAGLVRDLQMYLRQPAPDAVLARIAQAP